MRRASAVLVIFGLGVPVGCDKFSGGDTPPSKAAEAKAKNDAPAGKPASDGDPPAEAGGEADVADTPAGPVVAWNVQLATVPRTAIVTDAGTVLTVAENAIHGVADGAVAWAKEGAYTDLSRLSDGSVVTTTGATILAFDAATGEERFRVDVPTPPDWEATDRKGRPLPPPPVVAAATFGSQLLVADHEARFFVVDPPTCAKQEQACLRPAGALDGEVLEVGTRLTVGADGTRFLIEEDSLRVFDQALETLFELEAPGRIVGVRSAGGDRFALATNGRVSLLQLGKCRGTELRIPRVATGSKHCFLWMYGDDLDDAAPAVIDTNTLAVNGHKRLQAVSAGDDSWKSPIDSVGGVLIGAGGLLYTMAVDEGDGGTTIAVKAVDSSKGTVTWTVPLPFGAAAAAGSDDVAEVVIPENLRLDARGTHILAGLDQNLAVLSVPPG